MMPNVLLPVKNRIIVKKNKYKNKNKLKYKLMFNKINILILINRK
jgi:hypothetical protein